MPIYRWVFEGEAKDDDQARALACAVGVSTDHWKLVEIMRQSTYWPPISLTDSSVDSEG